MTSAVAIDADGFIYVGSGDNNLYKLDPHTGVSVWNFTAQGMIEASTPALWNNLVIFGSDDDNVYAVDRSTGLQVWAYTTQVNFDFSPEFFFLCGRRMTQLTAALRRNPRR